MKIPTDNIFRLIQSMTASEKRYFKRHYASEKNLTTELFDFINGLDSYSEELVKKHFAKSKLAKNLKVYKVQLMDLVLKSLTSYYNKKSIRSKIRMGLEEVEILLDKQLYEMARGRLKKIKELCIKHDEIEYIFSIIYYEIFLSSFFDIDLKPGEYAILTELDQYTDKIKSTYQLKKINFFLNDKHNNELTQNISPEERKEYQELLENTLALPQERQLSLSEQYYRNSALSILYKLVHNDPEQEFIYKEKNIDLFKQNEFFIRNNAEFYFAAQYNYLALCRRINKYEELEKGIIQIRDLLQQYPFLKRNAIFIHYLETKYIFSQQKYQEIVDRIEPQVTQHIKRYKQTEESLTALIFIYFILANLILKDYHKVHFYLRRVMSISKNLDISYQYFFYILELISHHETNDHFVIQNLLNSHKRKLKNSKQPNEFFRTTLSFFGDLVKLKDQDKASIVADYQLKIKAYSDNGAFKLSNEFILSDWLEAIKGGERYTERMLQ